jgi:sugar-phosphatase
MAAQLDAREAEEEGGEVAIPGAAALLAALPPERWAVVTSAYHAIAARRIASVGLPVPRVLLGADDVRAGKPDPEGYARAAERLGHAASRCVVFEDTSAGIEAGRASGALVVGLRTTYPELRDADIVIGDLRDVRVEPARGDGRIRLRLTAGT